MALLTMMSPLPVVWTPGPDAVVAVVWSVTLLVARLAAIVAAAAASTVRSIGSTSQVPVVPPRLLVSIVSPAKLTLAPEVSTRPPLPAGPVARALNVPLAVTVPAAPPSRTMLPPLPVAESVLTVPVKPIAARAGWGAVLAVLALAVPRALSSRIAPPSRTALSALSASPRLTMLRTALRAVAAEISTRPPLAAIEPATSISAALSPAIAAVGTATAMNPSPLRSSVIRSPEPNPTRPSGTVIVPLFDIVPPSSAT